MKTIHILEEQSKLIFEASGEDYDYLYTASEGTDITDVLKKYFSYSVYGETNPMFSKIACRIHKRLMYTLSLYHEDIYDRKEFAKILTYVKSLFDRGYVKKVELYDRYYWVIRLSTSDSERLYGDSVFIRAGTFINGNPYYYAIVFSSHDGFKVLDSENREGSENGSSGYFITKAVMTDEMKKRIKDKGLVPALSVEGSYHENFVKSVGVLPEYVSKLKHSCLFFDCKFDLNED